MRKLMVLVSMLTMVLLAASPAIAQTQNQQSQESQNVVGDIIVVTSNESSVEQGNMGDATAVGGDAQYAGGAQYAGEGGDAAASISDDDVAALAQENNTSVNVAQQSGQSAAGGDSFQFNFFGLLEALAALFD